MKIIQIAVFVFCVNIASAMILASGAFPSGTSPIGMEGLEGKMGNFTDIPEGAPKGGFSIVDEFFALSSATSQFISLTINAPGAFTYLVGLAIPDVGGAPTAVESVFTGGILILTWAIYAIALVELWRRIRTD